MIKKLYRNKVQHLNKINCGDTKIQINAYEEILPNGVKYIAAYRKEGTMLNTDAFFCSKGSLFFSWVIIEIVQRIADF